MATTMVDASAPQLYPRLYPTLEDPSALFLPIPPQEEQEGEGGPKKEEGEQEQREEARAGENGVAVEEEEAAGVGEGEREGQPGGQQGGGDLASVVSPSSQEVSDTGETTADAGNSAQTTNGETAMNGSAGDREKLTPQSDVPAGEGADKGQPTPREQYVDRVWEEFVTDFLLGSRHIQKAAIFDLATRQPLAVNGNLRISTEEMDQLVASLHHLQLAYRNGVTLEGKTYKVRLADGRNGLLARTEREGCTVCKTHTLIIVGVHDERGNSRKCNEDVMRLGDFFRKKAV